MLGQIRNEEVSIVNRTIVLKTRLGYDHRGKINFFGFVINQCRISLFPEGELLRTRLHRDPTTEKKIITYMSVYHLKWLLDYRLQRCQEVTIQTTLSSQYWTSIERRARDNGGTQKLKRFEK
jgi:hypothetical protein